MEMTIRIGGEAGQGMEFIGSVLARVFARRGLHVCTHRDVMSRIRGGHNFFQLRLADRPVHCSRQRVDILLALDGQTVDLHRESLDPRGVVLYDGQRTGWVHPEPRFFNIPFLGLTEELGLAPVMANSAAVGAVLGGLGLGLDEFAVVVAERMAEKGSEVVASNLRVARAAGDLVRSSDGWPEHFACGAPPAPPLALLSGSQAIATGAVLSGCKFYAACPMPPATGIMDHVASRARAHGIIVEQAEDDIAAINMALGASFGGLRAMTASAGGGFALMAEGLSLAGMTETPVVVAAMQRPGPATGMPSRSEQADLLFVLHAGPGEFPRVLFAPGTPEQALDLTNKAFDLAEKYQVPAIILGDQYLADGEWTCGGLAGVRLRLHDYRDRAAIAETPYLRYRLTASGVSPLAVPGLSQRLVVADSDEHDEEGHSSEDAAIRQLMVEKRCRRKWPGLRAEIAAPLLYGHDRPRVVLAGYGSTYGIMREAVDSLGEEGAAALLHFSELWPFPDPARGNYLGILQGAELAVCVENNVSGQFAGLVRRETGFVFPASIRKYDGRPFLLEPFLDELHGLVAQI